MNQEQKKLYNEFIKNGFNAGFTQEQIDFLWEYVMMTTLAMIKLK